MKPTTDPLDDLIAAALHGELTPQERTAFETRLQNDPAALAAYQESQLMHDLLEKTHREAQPDPAFEQRMVSGVRRKIQSEAQHRETSWESVVVLWRGVRALLTNRWMIRIAYTCVILLFVTFGARSYLHQHTMLITGMSDADNGISKDREGYAPASKLRSVIGEADKKISLNDALAESSSVNMEKERQFQQPSGTVVKSLDEPAPLVAEAAAAQPMAAPAASSMTPMGFAASSASDSSVAAPDHLVARLPVVHALKTEGRSSNRIADKAQESESVAGNMSEQVASTPAVPATAPTDTRKLIRNAQLDLEVKNYQAAIDQITSLTKSAGGYVDTSNSQKGGNGKLQGNVVVKILPENLDSFLLKLRDLGELKNQTLSTDDVTKQYFDTQGRMENSRRMETQLQELLKRDTGKVSELLEVERELGRVRGDIEQMQGQLKLYDFQVQYATVTISVQEKDLTQAAAYLLKENDQFALLAGDVENAFQQARHAADDFKAHILTANLNHNSGSDVSATMSVSVPPEQIDGFLVQIRSLGRVQNFTRQTERVARDGGDADHPADETRTEKDPVLVQLTIQSDNQSQKQVALTVITSGVDDALEKAKTAALASAGAEILSSSLNKTPNGPTTAQISVRVPGKNYEGLLDSFRALGRTSAFSVQRDDSTGPNSSGDDTPVTVTLALSDDEAPLQQTDLAVSSTNVDTKAQQLKKEAASVSIEIKSSSFERQPDGTETAQMTFQMPMSAYAAFLEKLKALGRVESLTVNRQDQPGQGDDAPAQISFRLYSEGQIVADDNGLWANLRRTFGEGAQALFDSIRTIGVTIAFMLPWVFLLGIMVWVCRRIYVACRG